jgi:hypothetical protein
MGACELIPPSDTAGPQSHSIAGHTRRWTSDNGLVNILGIILGVIAGGGSRTVLLAAGFAAAFTESRWCCSGSALTRR